MASIDYTQSLAAPAQGGFRATWQRAKRNFMISRMRTVLNEFGDAELAKMGITRDGIPERARALIDGDI